MKTANPGLSPQAYTIYDHLRKIGDISALEARAIYRVDSLSRRICDLKDAGYKVSRVIKKDATGKRYARYTLVA